jgi:hypothetical protein
MPPDGAMTFILDDNLANDMSNNMANPHNIIRIIVIVLVILFLISILIAASQLADKIPDAIKKRLDELKLKILDDQYTRRDLAFHRFFRPDYLEELKKVNSARKDEMLTKYLEKRRKLLIYLALSFMAVATVVIFYFRAITR